MSTSKVKFLHNGMTGAPVLTGVAGALIAVLDACLVDGWGVATVDSLVISGGIATITRAAGHPFEPDCVTEISGATLSSGSINGQHKVLTTTSTSYTIAATGIANQTATGTISHKVAALGWTRPFATVSNVAAYRLDAVDGTGMYLRVDDSGTGSARYARVVGYETMSDLNTGTGAIQWPTAAPAFWSKSTSSDATARSWTIVGDDRTFWMRSLSSSSFHTTQGFGDFASRKPTDPYRCALHCPDTDTTSAGSSVMDASTAQTLAPTSLMTTSYAAFRLARGASGLGSATTGTRSAALSGFSTSTSNVYSGQGAIAYPNAADNAMLLSPFFVLEQSGVRGALRGLYFCPQSLTTGFANHAVVTGVDILPGRRLRAMVAGSTSGSGFYFVDVTGPWAA